MQFDLKSFRTDLNLKQTDIQKILGITQGFVSKIENGKESFPSEYVDILSKKYSYDVVKKYIIDESKTSSRIRVSQKLRLIRERLNLSQKEMAEKLDLQQSQYSLMERGKVDFRMDKVQHLINLGISPVWFISSNDKTVNDETAAFNLEYNEPSTAFLGIDNNKNPQVSYSDGVPYYDVDFIGGFDLLMNDQTINPRYLIDFQKYNNADCWCNVTGRSMEPEISHGDIIALKEIQDWQIFLPYGEIYAIVTTELRTIKKVTGSLKDDCFLLIPLNSSPEFQPQEIPKSIILKVFKVLGCMKKI